MRVANLLVALGLLLIGVVVITDAIRLGIGWGTDGPKSGFFPFWLASILVITTALIVMQAAGRDVVAVFARREQLVSVMRVLGPAIAFVVLMQFLGLYVAGALYIGTSMRWLGRHRWVPTIGVAAGVMVGAFVIFEQWFLVPMPKGPLETWLGY